VNRFIGYHCFHTGRRCPPREAYAKTELALKRYSDRDEPSDGWWTLEMWSEEKGPMDSLCSEVCRRYGPIDRIWPGSSSGGPGLKTYQWKLNPGQFPGALELLEHEQEKLPSFRERMRIQVWWEFKFVNPENRDVLPGQENLPVLDMRLPAGSSLTLSLGDRAKVNAWFLFPFEEVSREFESYVGGFQKSMLFRFSPRHWRAWSYSRAGRWRPKRLDFRVPA